MDQANLPPGVVDDIAQMASCLELVQRVFPARELTTPGGLRRAAFLMCLTLAQRGLVLAPERAFVQERVEFTLTREVFT